TGLLTQRGAEQADGFEVDVYGKIGNNFSVTANYAYNDAWITESDDDSEIGLTKENAPLHSGGFFANYAFTRGILDGLNFNLGMSAVSERNTFERELQLPSYAVWDVGASYEVNRVRLALTLNNLADKTHWVGGYSFVRLFPGAPRNYLLSISYTF
ncbi:MAG: TonB-dependent receptor, partial [Bacteroidota bacterium]